MPNTNLIGGTWATNGAPLVPGSGSIPFNGGNYWYVCNRTGANGSNGNEGTADMPFSTLAFAISKCVADQGDVIVILSGHAESIIAAAGIAVSVAGITIIGEGNGADRPTFTFSTATTATMTITAANVTIANIVGITGIDQVVSPFVISAAGCTLGLPGAPVEWQDPSSSFQAVRTVLTTSAADKLKINLKTIGVTSGGTSPVNAIRLVGVDSGIINVDFYGRASTAVVEFVTTACTNIEIYGYMYNSGVTDYTKDVIDTVTGSTWFASFSDGAAGIDISGGSASALGPAQAATVIADLSVPSANATTNALERDVIGNKTDTAIYVPGTQNSNAAYAKGSADLQEKVTTGSTAVMVNGNTIFTVAGGAIKIEALYSICITTNNGTASTLQYSVTPTIGAGAQTISAASGSLASAAAGATVTLAGTALSTAALLSANGPNLIANPGTILCPAGIITIVIGVGSTTGTWKHFMRWKPLTTGVTVTGT